MTAKNEGASINEIKLSLSYWFHKIDRLDTKGGGNDDAIKSLADEGQKWDAG